MYISFALAYLNNVLNKRRPDSSIRSANKKNIGKRDKSEDRQNLIDNKKVYVPAIRVSNMGKRGIVIGFAEPWSLSRLPMFFLTFNKRSDSYPVSLCFVVGKINLEN